MNAFFQYLVGILWLKLVKNVCKLTKRIKWLRIYNFFQIKKKQSKSNQMIKAIISQHS